VERVYRYCYRRVGNRADAEDATSAVFIRALERLESFRGGSFRAWLFAIARTTVADRFRRPPAEALGEFVDVHDPAQGPDELAIASANVIELRRMLATLPADQGEAIELRLTGLKGAEVASVMKRSIAAVKMLNMRAMKRLRADMSAATGEEI
jgi:RNA polymerase sigma-70 factor (ECF subfamily)